MNRVWLFLSECAFRVLLGACMFALWVCHKCGDGVWQDDYWRRK